MQTENSLNSLPLRGGQNYAPVKPLEAIREHRADEFKKHYLTEALRERYEHFMAEDDEVWQDLISVGHLTSLFIQGKQDLKYNGLTKKFFAVPVSASNNDSNKRVTPIMRFYQTNIEARYMSSNPNITVTAGREDDRAEQMARAAKTIVDYYERKLYTNWNNRAEALTLTSFGTNIDRVRWDSGKQGWKGFLDIFEDREFPVSEGVGQCLDCGHAGTGVEYLLQSVKFPSCPECRSFNVYAEPPSTQIIPVQTGRQEINLGDLVLESLEFPALRFDLRRKAEESSFFIYEQMSNIGIVQRLLGDVSIPEDKTGANSFGLDVVASLAKAGLAISGKATHDELRTSLFRQKVKVTEMYLSPEDYADIKINGDEDTICGEKLPTGSRLTDLFPDGLVAVGLNGMQTLLGVYAETHKTQLTTGVWHIRQFSGAGQGVSDSVELNKRLNETDSQGYLGMRHNSTPATFYPAGAIEKQYLPFIGRPDVCIPVNMENFQNIRSMNDILSSPRIGQMDTAMISYQSENLRNMMQLSMNTTSFSGGLPGVNNRTATGAQITEANSNALFTPMIGIKRDGRIRKAEMFVRSYRENVPVHQFFPLKNKYGAQQGVWLAGADLDKDLLFDSVENSHLPRNAYTAREDHDRFWVAIGGAQGYVAIKQTDPEFLDTMMKIYGVEFENNHFDESAQICRQRFESAKKVLRQYAEAEAQMQSMMEMPADPFAADPMMQGAPGASEVIETRPNANGTFEIASEDVAPDEELEATLPPEPEKSFEQIHAETESALTQRQPGAQQGMMQSPAMMSPDPVQMRQMLAQMVVSAVQPPITIFEPNHTQKGEWFMYFLDTDEGRNLPPDQREVVNMLVMSHFTNAAEQSAIIAGAQGMIQNAGAMPGQVTDTAKQQYLNQNKPQPSGKR